MTCFSVVEEDVIIIEKDDGDYVFIGEMMIGVTINIIFNTTTFIFHDAVDNPIIITMRNVPSATAAPARASKIHDVVIFIIRDGSKESEFDNSQVENKEAGRRQSAKTTAGW